MQLLLLDGYIINKEYSKALNAVNEIDRAIDKDPILDYYRYLCYNLMNDDKKSKESLLRLMQNMPSFEDGMLELIVTYIEEKDYESAKPWVEKFRNRSSFDQDKLDMLTEGIDVLER